MVTTSLCNQALSIDLHRWVQVFSANSALTRSQPLHAYQPQYPTYSCIVLYKLPILESGFRRQISRYIMNSAKRAEAVKLHDELVLMSGLSGRASLVPAPTELRRRNETSESWNGLLPTRKESFRTAKILDALAQVGVVSKEIIAVAVAPPSETNKHTLLFIASDETVPIATQRYYRTLLRLIKQLALSSMPYHITVDPHAVSPSKNEATESFQVKGSCLLLGICKNSARIFGPMSDSSFLWSREWLDFVFADCI